MPPPMPIGAVKLSVIVAAAGVGVGDVVVDVDVESLLHAARKSAPVLMSARRDRALNMRIIGRRTDTGYADSAGDPMLQWRIG